MWWCVERRAAEGKIRFSRKNVIFTVQTNNTIFNRETPSERAVTGTTHTHTTPPCAQHMPGARTRRDGRGDAVTNEDPSKAGSRGLW